MKVLIGLNPGSVYGTAKRWLPERFAEVADRVAAEHGGVVLIFGGHGEEELGHAIAGMMTAPTAGRYLLDLRPGVHSALRRTLSEPRLERFIGAIYRPETERWSHYAEARLSEQFEAWFWFDDSTAVTPLPAAASAKAGSADDTWPFGV